MKNPTTFYSFIALALLFSCEPIEETFTPDPGVLFPDTYELDVSLARENSDNTLYFDLEDTQPDLLFIGIFKESPEVTDGELSNRDALIWVWEGAVEGNTKISLADGTIKSQAIDILNQPECIANDLFWSAWGWEGNARKLLYSTPINSLDLGLNNLPDVQFVRHQLIDGGDENQDGYIAAGEEVTIQLSFTNYGESIAKTTVIELNNVSLDGLPPSIILGDIGSGETVAKNITFKVPINSEYDEVLPIAMKIKYNECLIHEASTAIKVDGLNVCLESITVTEILYLPPLVLWDPIAILPIFFAPDMYNVLFLPDSDEVIQSITIEDANDDDLIGTDVLAQWPVYDPCLPLKLNKPYTFQVWDEDFLDEDDFIGEYTFIPGDYLATQDTVLFLETDLIRFELRFKWGN